jgi:small-conductance mechanosensitive channel
VPAPPERLAAVEAAGVPVAALAERLAGLHAQRDVALERLGPLEAALARELPLADEDPRPAVAALRERIEALQRAQDEAAAGLAALRAAGDGGGLAAVADQLTRLFAQKDAGVDALLGRLAPLETRLAALETRPEDPAADAVRAETQAVAARLAPLETRLAALERPEDPEADAARAEAEAVAARLALLQAAAEATAERTALFADRLTALEESLPRLSVAQAAAMDAAPEAADPGDEAPWALPRVVSLHQK